MNVQKRNEVAIYNLSSGPTLPEWLGDRARRNLSKRDEQVRRRIELIQDFQMPINSSKIVQSADGRYIMVGGTYPPRVRCYDVHDLTMKFERYVNGHIVDIVMLGEDYGKMGILMDDRTVAFHAHYGAHESVRVPKFGRAMAYESTTCELLVAASGNEIYRLNLEEGRFSEPWSAEPAEVSASCISVSNAQPLVAVGFDDGVVRFWDNRSPDTLLKPFLKLNVRSATEGYGFADEDLQHSNPHEITSIAHDNSGLYMAVGTAGGLVSLYDVRSSKPLHMKEHKHGMPIHTLKFHSGSGCILSSDEKLVKIWKYKSTGDLAHSSGLSADRFGELAATSDETNNGMGAVVANVEGTSKFSNFIMAGDEKDPFGSNSGLLMCTTDQPKLECFYVPKVGLAPKWCSFLENITEELEERDLKRDGGLGGSDLVKDGNETIFENYKFVSRDDLEKLGVADLIGTPMLRAYMHGFFMDINLYNRVRAVANPFEYEEYRKKKIKERMEAKRSSRIAPKETSNSKSAVNPQLAERLQDKAGDSTTKAGKVASRLLSDNRFGNLFTNPDFEIDEEDDNFKLRNPSGVAATKRKSSKRDDMDSDDDDDGGADLDERVINNNDDEIGFRRVQEDSDSGVEVSDESGEFDSDSDEDGFRGGKVRGEAYSQIRNSNRATKPLAKSERKRVQQKRTVMYEADDLGETNPAVVHASLGEVDAYARVKKKIKDMNMPLEKRFKHKEEENPYVKVTGKGGSKEITYVPKDARKKREEQGLENGSASKHQRRGIKELGLRRPAKKLHRR